MAISAKPSRTGRATDSVLAGPAINPTFSNALNALVDVAKAGHKPASEFFNPSKDWLVRHMRLVQDLPAAEQQRILDENARVAEEAKKANAEGKAAPRAGAETVVRLDTGGVAFFSQLGVARRPDLTQYFVDGFVPNRDAIAFSEANQALFAEVLPYLTQALLNRFAAGDTVVQCDHRLTDAPGRSFHARLLLYGVRYLQVPHFWRQLTFDLPASEQTKPPDILEVSFPRWLEDVPMPEPIKARVRQAGLTQLVFKAPTRGLSMHLGFDYVGEHKMGPLSIGMFKVKQEGGLAIQAALSAARIKTLEGRFLNTAMITTGPSLHGKSTLTITIELAHSDLAKLMGLPLDPAEGVYPMNDDIVFIRPVQPSHITRGGKTVTLTHAIDGTENNLYAVPFGLSLEGDPVSYAVLRGTKDAPNADETLENVPVDLRTGKPDFMSNPTRNMRMVLSRPRLVAEKKTTHVIKAIAEGRLTDSVHIPMENMDRVFWQAVMRQNTVIPPLRRLSLEQYIRVLMYGEAVQMGAAAGALGRPYVEYFSDPFIIGLEDDNANLMLDILHTMAKGGMPQHYYVFNTGGVGADTNEQAFGPRYKKIPRELTLMLQEALLRGAVKFEQDTVLRSDVAVGIMDSAGKMVLDIREAWLPRYIYGEDDYTSRIVELTYRRYYGGNAKDKAGILRYTKVSNALHDLTDIPAPRNERELAALMSFYWGADQAYETLPELAAHLGEGSKPEAGYLQGLQDSYQRGMALGLVLPNAAKKLLPALGLQPK